MTLWRRLWLGALLISGCAATETPTGDPSRIFVDVTYEAGVEARHIGVGAYLITGQAWGDVDRDGVLDLYVTTSVGANQLLLGRGDGTFRLSPLNDHVALVDRASGGAVIVDYDNDGWPDLYVTDLGPNALLRNLEGRGFADVTREAGVAVPGQGESSSWADYDLDGHLDLYVANWFCDEQCQGDSNDANDRLFHSRGDGTFEDVSYLLGDRLRDGAGFIAAFADLDDDGDADIYLLNDKGSPTFIDTEPGPTARNVLWLNEGPGCGGWCFREAAVELGADARLDAMGVAVGDIDEDLDLDLYMSNTGPAMLLRNDGPEGFTSDAAARAVDHSSISWATSFIDLDNDGLLDLYLAVGDAWSAGGNRIFRNRGAGAFEDLSLRDADQLHGYTVGVNQADFDGDGGLDLVVGDRNGQYRLLRNLAAAATDNTWIRFRLEGRGSVNRDAVGARVEVTTTSGRRLRRDVVLGSGIGGNDDLALHFGLGRERVAEAEITWPGGETRRFLDPAVGLEHYIVY